MTISTLTFREFVSSLREAVALLAAYPLRWLLLILAFFVIVESLMFAPYVGFIAKVVIAGLVTAQFLVLFSGAADGNAPRLRDLFGVFSLRWSKQLTLALLALFTLAVGLAYLVIFEGGLPSIAFFLGNILEEKPPSPEAFFRFKIVMSVVAPISMFIPPAIVLLGASGWSAVKQGLAASRANWPILLVLLAMAISFESLAAALPLVLPQIAAGILIVLLVLAFIAFELSLGYTLAARVFGLSRSRSAESSLSRST